MVLYLLFVVGSDHIMRSIAVYVVPGPITFPYTSCFLRLIGFFELYSMLNLSGLPFVCLSLVVREKDLAGPVLRFAAIL